MFHVMFDVRPYLRDLSSMEQLSSMSGFVRSLELFGRAGCLLNGNFRVAVIRPEPSGRCKSLALASASGDCLHFMKASRLPIATMPGSRR